MSAAADEVDDLEHVPACERLSGVLLTIAKNRSIVLDDNQAWIQAERAKELRQRAIPRNLPWRAVHRQGDDPARFRSPNHTLKYSG